MYFEIWKADNLIKRGKASDILGELSWSHELMEAPTMNLTLPIEYHEYLDGREYFKVFVNDKCFWGIVKGIELDKVNETMDIDLTHAVCEWEYRQISVNHAISDKELNVVYKGDKVKKDKGNDEAITATDFTILSKRVSKMTDAKYIKKAYATAWKISNGDKVEVVKVDASKVKAKEGEYDVKFSTKKGTTITVSCNVIAAVTYGEQKKNADKSKDVTIKATAFEVDIEEAKRLDADDIKKLGKAKAYVYKHPKQTLDITGFETNFEASEGEYKATYTAKGVSITITVTVTGETNTSLSDPSIVDKIEDIYNNDNFAYPGWEIDWRDDSATRMIDYVYSRQNRLEALTKTMELTDDLWWRVGFTNQKLIEVGKFGEQKPYNVSIKPSGQSNIGIIEEPTISYDFDNVINVATVYSEKSDSGMSSLTLREVYNASRSEDETEKEKYGQKDGFPVVILRGDDVNNERDYSSYTTQYPKLAPNNEYEYAVIDIESVALESGILIEGTYAFNDLGSFETDSKKITDKKRKKAAKTAYNAAIRKLKQARRSYDITVKVEEIPPDINVGDKVRFIYDNNIWNLDACSNYWKKILGINDKDKLTNGWFYITKIDYSIDGNEVETNELTLTKWLKVDRDLENGD